MIVEPAAFEVTHLSLSSSTVRSRRDDDDFTSEAAVHHGHASTYPHLLGRKYGMALFFSYPVVFSYFFFPFFLFVGEAGMPGSGKREESWLS